MLKLKKRFKFRVPDRLAVAAALLLIVTALGGVVGNMGLDHDGQPVPAAHVMKTQQVETRSDDVVERHGAKARLLLFRRG